MTELFDEEWEAYNEREVLEAWLIHKAKEIPDLNISTNPADVEELTWLLMNILDIYFSKIMLPPKLRPYIFTLACLEAHRPKDGEGWFYVWDVDVPMLLMHGQGKPPKGLIQRMERKLDRWQTDTGLEAVLIDRDYVEPVRNAQGEILDITYGVRSEIGKPARYKLNLLTDVLEILTKHHLNPKLLAGLKSIMMELDSELRGWKTSRDFARRANPGRQRRRAYFFARSNMKKVIEHAREHGHDPVGAVMNLVKEVTRDIRPDARVDTWLRGQLVNNDEPTS
jgi:hypothetical protein